MVNILWIGMSFFPSDEIRDCNLDAFSQEAINAEKP